MEDKRLYGEGMTFYATPENYEKKLKDVEILYPLAKVKLVDKIIMPELTLEEKILLGLIEKPDVIYDKEVKNNEEVKTYSSLEICFAA